jgi:hypothetical protein
MKNAEEIRLNAGTWMASRGWKQKLAKKFGREQSLFEHSLIELDVLLELLPILARSHHYNLTETEQQILQVAVVVHDAGKERGEWQAHIANPKAEGWVPHILPELTRAVVPAVCAALGFAGLGPPVEQIMAHCADLHHSKPGRSDGLVMAALLGGGSDRFLTLAHIVRAIDRGCSALTALEAKATFEIEPALRNHLLVATHQVSVRGVSTVFLHSAARAAFAERGWKVLLYFADGTLYAAEPNDRPAAPSVDAIRAHLERAIDGAIARDVTRLMVGSPTGNILPKPDLLAFTESRKYLVAASRKVGGNSFARKPPNTKRRVVEDYWKLKAKQGVPTVDDVNHEADRISRAQPEMMVFKLFKAMMDCEKVTVLGERGSTMARELYENVFGKGSWAALQSTSTLMPAKDMAKTVDYFWSLSGNAINRPEFARVEELPDQARLEALIELLSQIAQNVYASLSCRSPRDELSTMMAESFSQDLVFPTDVADVRSLAELQLDHYSASKPFAGKESTKGKYLCPTCNAAFTLEGGHKASADFIDNPQTHTNRGIAHGSFGYVMICTTCYYERLLRQVLLGSRPAEMITLMPRLNIGPGKGEHLVTDVREWVEAAKKLLMGETGGLHSGFSLAFTHQTARQLGDRDASMLPVRELVSLFSYPFAPETQKKRRSEAMKRLREEFDDDLEVLKSACSEPFPDWDSAVDALIENRINQQEVKAIRREVFRLYETIRLICETPNLIFIPLTYEIASGSDESETNKALRCLYVALILSLVFEASVAVQKEGERVDFSSACGAAYVPPVPAVRSLTGGDWVSIGDARRWLRAIGAASLLAGDAAFSERSDLYQVLAADPPERLVRRLEEKLKENRKALTVEHFRNIEILREVHR